MARGTQHLKKRPNQAAVRQPPRQRSRAEVRRARRMEESGMFFPSLRRHAKWVFVLLAIVFAAGFVFFGVGSGSNGIGNILQNWLNIGGSSGPSISSLQATARAHPNSAQAFRNLASAYEGKQDTTQAIAALSRYTQLRPKDANALQELAGLYGQRVSELSSQYSSIAVAPVASASAFAPAASTPLGRAYATVLADPISQAVQAYGQQQQSDLGQQATTAAQSEEGVYKKLVALDPTDATTQIQLAQSAQAIGDVTTAVAAYKQARKLDPSTYGSLVAQQLKQLQPTTSTTTAPSTSKSKHK